MYAEPKAAIITGAGGGLGSAVAVLLAEKGYGVVLTDIDAVRLDEACTKVGAAGGTVRAVPGDVTSASTLEAVVGEALSGFGRIDALCNVAGISPAIPLEDTTPEDFDRIMRASCLSAILGIQAVLPQMRRQGGGAVVNVASIGGLVALPMLAAYCASKSALLGLTRAVATELADSGIRCNAVCPGGIDTPMAQAVVASFPDRDAALSRLTGRQLIKRFADPVEIARVVAFLASDDASFVNGAVVAADGGHSAW